MPTIRSKCESRLCSLPQDRGRAQPREDPSARRGLRPVCRAFAIAARSSSVRRYIPVRRASISRAYSASACWSSWGQASARSRTSLSSLAVITEGATAAARRSARGVPQAGFAAASRPPAGPPSVQSAPRGNATCGRLSEFRSTIFGAAPNEPDLAGCPCRRGAFPRSQVVPCDPVELPERGRAPGERAALVAVQPQDRAGHVGALQQPLGVRFRLHRSFRGLAGPRFCGGGSRPLSVQLAVFLAESPDCPRLRTCRCVQWTTASGHRSDRPGAPR